MTSNDIQKQLAKLRRDKRVLWLGVLFFVLVVLWILVSIFATSKTSVVSQELRDLAKPFVPRLESKIFDEILGKRAFTKEDLAAFPIYIFDKKSVDGGSVKIDIIQQANQLLLGSTSQLPQSANQIGLQQTASESGQENQVDVASEAATQEVGNSTDEEFFMPIPIEDIIGPQNQSQL